MRAAAPQREAAHLRRARSGRVGRGRAGLGEGGGLGAPTRGRGPPLREPEPERTAGPRMGRPLLVGAGRPEAAGWGEPREGGSLRAPRHRCPLATAAPFWGWTLGDCLTCPGARSSRDSVFRTHGSAQHPPGQQGDAGGSRLVSALVQPQPEPVPGARGSGCQLATWLGTPIRRLLPPPLTTGPDPEVRGILKGRTRQ